MIASETAIANIDGKHGDGLARIPGLSRSRSSPGSVSYEETAFLLLHGDLPNPAQLADFQARIRRIRAIPDALVDLFRTIPESIHPMDVLRTSVSVLSHFDPDVNAAPTDHAANVRKAERMVAQMPTAVAATANGSAEDLPIIPPQDDLDHSANFLQHDQRQGPFGDHAGKAFDLSLVLYTEHELNASTFCGPGRRLDPLRHLLGRSSPRSAPSRGRSTAGRTRRRGRSWSQVGSPENARQGWIQDALARKERIMGFGHRVYKTGDPRARILKEYCGALAAEQGDDRWERVAEPIERVVTELKKLPPNVDWPCARLYHYLGLSLDIYTPIFAMARVAGWAAHIIEQLDHNRLMRPRARYVGPPTRSVIPIDARK